MNISKAHKYVLAVMVILLAVLVYLCFLLVHEYKDIRATEVSRGHSFQLAHRTVRTLTAADTKNITSWMTFDFINRVFHVPADYLQNTLQITDIKYPGISLGVYARNHALDEVTFMGQVQTEVAAYLNSQTLKQ